MNAPVKPKKKKKKKQVEFEYCFCCKDLQEITKDGQCKQCFSYIKF